MSGDNTQSREAQLSPEDKKVLDSFLRKGRDDFLDYLNSPENISMVQSAGIEVLHKFKEKCDKNGFKCPVPIPNAAKNLFAPGSLETETGQGARVAPAIIKEKSSSVPLPPPESDDIQYSYALEKSIGERINVLDYRLISDPDAPASHPGPWIQFCTGRDAETRKLMVTRVPAKEVKIIPRQVVRYLGSVVADHNAVHTATVLMGKERRLFVFDRAFIYNGKRYDRCCLVDNPVHQAGLVYEKWVPKEKTEGFAPGRAYARLRRMPGPMGGNQPMYGVFSYQETDMRDLKRLFERHFLKRGDVIQDEDPALRELFRAMPLVAT